MFKAAVFASALLMTNALAVSLESKFTRDADNWYSFERDTRARRIDYVDRGCTCGEKCGCGRRCNCPEEKEPEPEPVREPVREPVAVYEYTDVTSLNEL